MNPSQILVYLSIVHHGDWDDILEAVQRHEDIDLEEAEKVVSAVPTSYFTLLDPLYPSWLKNIHRPPFVLFYRGNIELIQQEEFCLSVVGSREASDYAYSSVHHLCEELACEGIGIVSGLARGIDTAALSAAVSYGKGIAVLGNGLQNCYPTENHGLQRRLEREGLVLSEYPYKEGPDQKHFPARNRIIAGLGKALFVGEAKKGSGSMISAGLAAQMGKDIGTLPFHADEESACNRMIIDGAALIENKEDLLDLLGFPPGSRPAELIGKK